VTATPNQGTGTTDQNGNTPNTSGGEGLIDAVEDAGEGVANGAEDIIDGAENAVDDVGDGAKDMLDGTTNTPDSSARKTTNSHTTDGKTIRPNR
jgi:hypothetical protein